VTSPSQAAALVFASNPIFSSISPTAKNALGQTSYYNASETGDGFAVSVTLGTGDCASSCITKHTWNYAVTRHGQVTLDTETGDPVDVPPSPGTSDPATVNVSLVAGPVCPVERNPPDPACAPRPVPDATVVLRDVSGAQVDRATSDASGKVTFTVAGGAYYIEPATIAGVMGEAQSTAFSVVGGGTVAVQVEYDTGIR
jgi:hypothetical protein